LKRRNFIKVAVAAAGFGSTTLRGMAQQTTISKQEASNGPQLPPIKDVVSGAGNREVTSRLEPASPKVVSWFVRCFKILGPGLITGAADDDPSGIATYAQVIAYVTYAK
jgi:hypothetical protein